MFGKNPKRPPENTDGSLLFVQEIFPTIQAEGIFAGRPAIFIRLGGCNLACSFCDTEFENFSQMSLEDILAQVQKHQVQYSKINLIVITGGEPMRQNIIPLCNKLHKNFTVQIETNGTIYRNLPDFVKVICSPKIVNGKYTIPADGLQIDALKFLISASLEHYNKIPDWAFDFKEIFIQPMDEQDAQKNAANNALAVKIAMENNLKLSIQMHKFLQIP
ncbi:7-carboxy-7-deazaguanine synthase QueE [Candidatus Deianiraea vastatrix]|uniref:7-carboxy-7-deazaguanine synthase n=1 Tax=Candidatus Deianiraea vastatrix TaxID=2163644 RepID=A0A5B8XI86_9RICK|nr:7-carboxy-7-deazaguanine synthase QueE [Candidatus Deianiraea vastatrix]QED23724.1 Putative queE-like radical SAM protein [Candidatus Deianiraea vastatrix]